MPFTTDLFIRDADQNDGPSLVGEGKWCLAGPLIFESTRTGGTYMVPAGFHTDMASVPRIPIVWEFTGACAHKAAVLHDYGCEKGEYLGSMGYGHTIAVTRAEVDALFLEAMRDTGVPWILRRLMWAAVRIFGMVS